MCGCKGIDVLVGKPERKKAFGRTRYRWKHNIKWTLKQIGGCGFDSPGSRYVQVNK
jgi:hypothetical protein